MSEGERDGDGQRVQRKFGKGGVVSSTRSECNIAASFPGCVSMRRGTARHAHIEGCKEGGGGRDWDGVPQKPENKSRQQRQN